MLLAWRPLSPRTLTCRTSSARPRTSSTLDRWWLAPGGPRRRSPPVQRGRALLLAEDQAVVVVDVAHPRVPQPVRRQALVVLQPDPLVLERVDLGQPAGEVPGERIHAAALLHVLDDHGEVAARPKLGVDRGVDGAQLVEELLVVRDVAEVMGGGRIGKGQPQA